METREDAASRRRHHRGVAVQFCLHQAHQDAQPERTNDSPPLTMMTRHHIQPEATLPGAAPYTTVSSTSAPSSSWRHGGRRQGAHHHATASRLRHQAGALEDEDAELIATTPSAIRIFFDPRS